ncbi:hypothetical protein NMG60_11034924 [Bertholletia excelsa]
MASNCDRRHEVEARNNECNNDRLANSNRGEEEDLYSQLWHACAGHLLNVPHSGDMVFYFPQGHIEQLEVYINQDATVEMPAYRIPSRILCKVVNVHLKAEACSDEVYAHITLFPEEKEPSLNDKACQHPPRKTSALSFTKKLTPSDTSTHGGLSVPKKCADECFPPLDLSQEPPAQELVVKDLQGLQWRFRHTYRGQPKRHLLTSGWSTFVSAKKLVAGDVCIFMRGENGEIRLGIRRAKKLPTNMSACVVSGNTMQHGILSSASHAISTGAMFSVYYHPWTCPAEFLIPYDHYMKTLENDYSIGTRIRMQVEGDECLERKCSRYAGTIAGVDDIDRVRWPSSEWRCLTVKWDAPLDGSVCPERVSPWSIELVDVKKKSIAVFLPDRKRWRPSGPSTSQPSLLLGDGANEGAELSRSFGSKDWKTVEGYKSPLSQPNGKDKEKCMLFGVNISSNPSETIQSSISESVQISEQSNSGYDDLPEIQCCNCYSIISRTCTKVLKHGSPLGRSVDLSRLNGYDELIGELDRMFQFNGRLVDKSSGWHVTYTDGEGDMMLMGDYPWREFRAVVRKMFICPKEMLNDDFTLADASNFF